MLIRVPEGSWSFRELSDRVATLASEARHLFGRPFDVEIASTEAAPEALPFPVLASKTWNHVAFCAWSPSGSGTLVVRKPMYLETWLPAAAASGDHAIAIQSDPEVAWLAEDVRETSAELPPENALPELLERLCHLARATHSYAHLVSAFPGDVLADRLEARLYAVKEWGTPRVPAGVLQKFVGRLHYVDPERPVLGLRLANGSLGGSTPVR